MLKKTSKTVVGFAGILLAVVLLGVVGYKLITFNLVASEATLEKRVAALEAEALNNEEELKMYLDKTLGSSEGYKVKAIASRIDEEKTVFLVELDEYLDHSKKHVFYKATKHGEDGENWHNYSFSQMSKQDFDYYSKF